MASTHTPSNPARILLVGAGGIGQRHIRGYLKTARARLDIVEPHPQRRAQTLESYEIGTSYSSLEEADLSTYDAAVICAPAHLHVPLGLTCARANLPFFLEKPLAVTMDGVEDLCDEVASRKLSVRVGYVRRASEETRELKRRSASGEIGELKLAYLNMSQDFRKYRPDYRETYYAKQHMGGGVILDAASHAIDLLIWLFGRATEVTAMHDRMVFEGVECEDTALILIRFASGAMAQLSLNQFQKPNIQVLEVIGTEGNLRLDMADLAVATDDSGRWEHHDYAAGVEPMTIHENRFAVQAGHYLDTLQGTEVPLATLDEARHNLEIALAAKRSWEERRIISL